MADPEVRPPIVVTARLPKRIECDLARQFASRHLPLREIGAAQFVEQLGSVAGLVVAPGDIIDAALIDALPPDVRIIASYSTGLDHIDIGRAAQRGIAIAGTPGVLTDATADIAMLLILLTVRGARDAMQIIDSGQWTGWKPDAVYGRDMSGLTLGIAGPGAIGLATAQRARAFGMPLCYWGRRPSPAFAALSATWIENWHDFLGQVDVLSLHMPATTETRNLVNADALSRMRTGAFLINTARGDLIDDDAVIAALTSGQLAGVGLDVIRGEPHFNPRWYQTPNTVLLPHIGSATGETRDAMGRSVIAALCAALLDTPQ